MHVMISMSVAVLAGTALRTIAPAHMPGREIEQGLGQLDAPLYQQNAAGVGSIVAPTEILPSGQMARQNEPDLHGQGQDAPDPGDAPQTQGSDTHGQVQGPPVSESQKHDASIPGIGAEHQGGRYVNGHVGGAQGSGQDAHRAGQNASGQDGDRPGPSASSQSKQPADKGTDAVSHSGVLEGECAVSSRESAQHHLQSAAPLPWQLPKDCELANEPASERQA